ncbi:MAG: FAD-dependent oxidoreductase [Planctomycetota bacterium]|nr:FAD-dependent oxidoreductase [Planctomycetota bacterium]
MKDVAILGGGVVGLFTARRLALEGWRVTLLEARRVGGGASGSAVGVLQAPRLSQSAFSRLSREGGDSYGTIAAELFEETGIDTGYQPCGCIYLRHELPSDPDRELAFWKNSGVEASWCGGDRVEELIPGYGGEQAFGLELDREAVIDPASLLAALRASCLGLGVELIEETGHLELEEESGLAKLPEPWASRLGAEPLVVVAAGCWTPAAVEPLGLERVALEPVRGQAIELELAPPACVVHFSLAGSGNAYYLVPKPGGRTWVGSTVEEAGYDESTTPHGLAELLVAARTILPAATEDLVSRQWAGLRPKAMRLGGPFIGRWPGVENLWIAAGNFKTGIIQAPATARILCDAMTGGCEIDQSFSLLGS